VQAGMHKETHYDEEPKQRRGCTQYVLGDAGCRIERPGAAPMLVVKLAMSRDCTRPCSIRGAPSWG